MLEQAIYLHNNILKRHYTNIYVENSRLKLTTHVIVVAQDEWSPKPEVAQDSFYCIINT